MSSWQTTPAATRPPAVPNRKTDPLTIVAISVIAAAISNVLHEGLGHGGACLLSGAHVRLLSTVALDCSVDSCFIAAGGTIANLIAGSVCLMIARYLRPSRVCYFFWVMMVFNLLDAGGYLLFSGIGNMGDWADVIHRWQPAWAWRLGLMILGCVSYYFLVHLSACDPTPMLAPDREEKLRRCRRFTFLPYFTNGILHTIAGLLNPFGMLLVVISAMADSFGGTSGLLWMGLFIRGNRVPATQTEAPPIERSWGWIAVAVAVACLFVLVLGRGIRFSA